MRLESSLLFSMFEVSLLSATHLQSVSHRRLDALLSLRACMGSFSFACHVSGSCCEPITF